MLLDLALSLALIYKNDYCDLYNCTVGGLIPLHNACSFGHVEVTLLLLRHGADVNSRDNWNYTPLHEAAIKGKVEVCLGKQIRHFIAIYKFGEFAWSVENQNGIYSLFCSFVTTWS